MSYILDALKKIERQKQAAEGTDDALPVMEGGRRWGETRPRISFTMVGVVAIALAALVLAGLALIQAYREDASSSSSIAARPTMTESSGGQLDQGGAELVPPEPSPLPPPPAVPSSDVDLAAAKSRAVAREEPEESETQPEEELEVIHPVRLTGQGEPGSTEPEVGVSEDVLDEPPEGAPELVLQGTSVVEGRPVAVVNLQRLFEGDTIEGAKVIRIMDRVVEMEFDGKRFVIEF